MLILSHQSSWCFHPDIKNKFCWCHCCFWFILWLSLFLLHNLFLCSSSLFLFSFFNNGYTLVLFFLISFLLLWWFNHFHSSISAPFWAFHQSCILVKQLHAANFGIVKIQFGLIPWKFIVSYFFKFPFKYIFMSEWIQTTL